MKLRCLECGAHIPAANINLERMVAKCGECNAVFGFADQLGNDGSARSVARPPVARPAALQIEQTGDEILFTRRWLHPSLIFLALFAVVWNGFMAVWFTFAIIEDSWSIALSGIGHAAIGILVTYLALAGFLNSTVVRVSRGEIDVRHTPLPSFGNRRLQTASIAQLYSKEVIHSRGSTHEVHVVTRDGRDVKLLVGLDTPAMALYYEQEIERYLGIKDRPVRGEIVG